MTAFAVFVVHHSVKIGILPKDWAGDGSNNSEDFRDRPQPMGIAALNPSYGLWTFVPHQL
jgi:hypothetical protein